ncbi:hypothetical protein [Sulfoacidibacillus thermotolerans]|uniref:Uncharacterized protein n=1 Tax=Sulfoacidibacillus thermotolerans TaxID=1765684 RepID=A0A2U3D8D9_SULT2|nr:hypothetical protein [Sulfoacidibacillus thermotolerans]PWI57554.1 hypothetical protein BM613_08005 [Sulfoacidibacillus thermotolerans]
MSEMSILFALVLWFAQRRQLRAAPIRERVIWYAMVGLAISFAFVISWHLAPNLQPLAWIDRLFDPLTHKLYQIL